MLLCVRRSQEKRHEGTHHIFSNFRTSLFHHADGLDTYTTGNEMTGGMGHSFMSKWGHLLGNEGMRMLYTEYSCVEVRLDLAEYNS